MDINALQRIATVVIQKSIREGFGLVVAEAMWKGKPVIGSHVGGIRRQIINGSTGFFVYSDEGTAHRIKELIMNRDLSQRMGRNAREQVRHSFLITRHLKDYLMVIKSLTA
jgi:trehalose synthase